MGSIAAASQFEVLDVVLVHVVERKSIIMGFSLLRSTATCTKRLMIHVGTLWGFTGPLWGPMGPNDPRLFQGPMGTSRALKSTVYKCNELQQGQMGLFVVTMMVQRGPMGASWGPHEAPWGPMRPHEAP